MPIDPESLLFKVIDDAAFELSTAANQAQMTVDAFIRMNPGIDATALLSSTEGGVVKGALDSFMRAIRKQLGQSVFRAFGEGKNSAILDSGTEAEFVWHLGGSKGGPCPDCRARQGRVETYEYWETVGLPQSGFSVCGGWCHCSIRKK